MPNAKSLKLLPVAPFLFRRRISRAKDLDRFPKLREASLVTLDVFDTALLRAVSHPDDGPTLAAWRAISRLRLPQTTEELIGLRQKAERHALIAAQKNGLNEVRIESVYEHLELKDQNIRASLLEEELQTERDISYPNPEILKIYRDLRESGVRVGFLSDTKYSSDFIKELLAAAGYDGPLEVYVSSSIGLTKASGLIFKLLEDMLGLRGGEIWHIGDNVRSDVLQATRAGWHCIWYRRGLFQEAPHFPMSGAKDEIAQSLEHGIRRTLRLTAPEFSSTFYEIGIDVASTFYLAFVQWLLDALEKAPSDRVYFLARDAYIIREFYDRLRHLYDVPSSIYLFVSRRSLVFPMIERLEEKELDFLCSANQKTSLKDFFSRIDIDISEYTDEIHAVGLSLGELIESPDKQSRLRSLFKKLEPIILKKAKAERPRLLEYLHANGFDLDGSIAICDVGYHATSQKTLSEIRGQMQWPAQLTGYYAYTSATAKQVSDKTVGWLENGGQKNFGYDFMSLGWVLMDFLFSSPHGTTISYRQREGLIEPVLLQRSADESAASAMESVRDASIRFLNAYLRAFGGVRPLDINQDLAVEKLVRLLREPSPREAAAIGDLLWIDGLGSSVTASHIATLPTLSHVVKKPSTLLSSYHNSLWRRAFLTRLLRSRMVVRVATSFRSAN